MTKYVASDGQTIYDVCLNTYVTLDLLVKLMVDNGHPGVNVYPYSGQEFWYDETLVANQNISSINVQNSSIYATRP